MLSAKIAYFRPTGFDPRSISGLAGWWDASDAASVTTVSGAVSQLNDKSGLGRHATQTTAANRPAYNISINGRNAMLFDGSNDSLLTGLESNALTGLVTLFCVCRPDFASASAAANRTPLFGRDNPSTSSAYGLNLFNEPPLRMNTMWRGAQFNAISGPLVDLGAVSVIAGGVNSTEHVRRVDGIGGNLAITPTAGTNAAAGNFLNIGQDPTQLRWWLGAICEAIVYSRALTTAEIQTTEGYLAWKWGTQARLPSNHPHAYSFAGLGSQARPTNVDALNWESRVYANGGTVSVGTLAAVNNFCNAVDAAGIRDRFYRLNLFCGTGLSACLVPLYRGTSLAGTQFGNTIDTNSNFVSGDYTETGTSGGLKAGSTKYLNTGFLPVTAGLTPFDSHMSFYSRSQITTNSTILGSFGGGTNAASYQILGFGGLSSLYYRSGGGNNSGIEAATWSGANRAGHVICVRTASNAAKAYRNGSDLGVSASVSDTNTWTPGVPPEIYIFGRNNVGTADQLGFTGALQSYSLGQSFTDAQASAFSSALIAFQTALSRN